MERTEARQAGYSRLNWVFAPDQSCRPLRGLNVPKRTDSWGSRFTPGFMLSCAPRTKNLISGPGGFM